MTHNNFKLVEINNDNFSSSRDILIKKLTYSDFQEDESAESPHLELILVNYKNKTQISISFEKIESYRLLNESYLFQGVYDLNNVSGEKGILFKSSSSSYLKWLDEISDGVYKNTVDICKHYLILTQEGIVEIISNSNCEVFDDPFPNKQI